MFSNWYCLKYDHEILEIRDCDRIFPFLSKDVKLRFRFEGLFINTGAIEVHILNQLCNHAQTICLDT